MRDLSTEMIQNRMLVKNEHNYGDVVYLKTDEEQLPRLVTGFTVRDGQSVHTYELTCGTDVSDHYPIEITKDKNIL